MGGGDVEEGSPPGSGTRGAPETPSIYPCGPPSSTVRSECVRRYVPEPHTCPVPTIADARATADARANPFRDISDARVPPRGLAAGGELNDGSPRDLGPPLPPSHRGAAGQAHASGRRLQGPTPFPPAWVIEHTLVAACCGLVDDIRELDLGVLEQRGKIRRSARVRPAGHRAAQGVPQEHELDNTRSSPADKQG